MEDFVKLGYEDFPTPLTPSVWATIAFNARKEFCTIVQGLDNNLLVNVNNEGLHTLTFFKIFGSSLLDHAS